MGTTFTLPDDWLERIESLEINTLVIDHFEKAVANVIKSYILRDRERSVGNRIVQVFLQFIFNGRQSFLVGFDNIPISLVENVLSEIGTERGQAFNNKLHSAFIELLAYRKLNDVYGYEIVDHNRQDGDCDLIVNHRASRLEIEVKHKRNPESPFETISNYLFGASFLPNNEWMHGSKYVYTLKIERPDDRSMMQVIDDAQSFFIQENKIEFETDTIRITREKNMPENMLFISKDSNFASLIVSPTEEDLYSVMDGVLIDGAGSNKHIDKLFAKFGRGTHTNFSGFVAWSLPWFWEEDEYNDLSIDIKNALMQLIREKYGRLPFDLYIWASGFKLDKMILLPKDKP